MIKDVTIKLTMSDMERPAVPSGTMAGGAIGALGSMVRRRARVEIEHAVEIGVLRSTGDGAYRMLPLREAAAR